MGYPQPHSFVVAVALLGLFAPGNQRFPGGRGWLIWFSTVPAIWSMWPLPAVVFQVHGKLAAGGQPVKFRLVRAAVRGGPAAPLHAVQRPCWWCRYVTLAHRPALARSCRHPKIFVGRWMLLTTVTRRLRPGLWRLAGVGFFVGVHDAGVYAAPVVDGNSFGLRPGADLARSFASQRGCCGGVGAATGGGGLPGAVGEVADRAAQFCGVFLVQVDFVFCAVEAEPYGFLCRGAVQVVNECCFDARCHGLPFQVDSPPSWKIAEGHPLAGVLMQ